MGKGFIYGLVVGAPLLAILLFVALEKDEQTRAERAELSARIQQESTQIQEVFYESWGESEASDRARSQRMILERELAEKKTRLAKAEKASEESMIELQKALEAQSRTTAQEDGEL